MQNRHAALSAINQLGLSYEMTEHPAVYTIDEMQALDITLIGEVCKNLFLRDAKGRNHYLIVMTHEKKADIKSIAAQLGTTKLSFASEDRLLSQLGLTKGAVTPLGIINDKAHTTTVVFDEDLRKKEKLGVHPNDNTATVWLSFEALEQLVSHYCNEIRYIKL